MTKISYGEQQKNKRLDSYPKIVAEETIKKKQGKFVCAFCEEDIAVDKIHDSSIYRKKQLEEG